MTPCPRCGTARAGTPTCPRCGPAPASGPSTPGPVVALRVLLGLSVAGYAMTVLMAVLVASFASSFASTIAGGPLDDGTSTTLRGLGTAMLGLGLLAAVSGAVELWAVVAVTARRRGVRTAITVVQVVDLLLAPAIVAAVGTEALLPVLLAMPFAVTLLVLTWVPESSRRWFAGTDAPARPAAAAVAVAVAVDDAPTVAFARTALPLHRPDQERPHRLEHRSVTATRCSCHSMV